MKASWMRNALQVAALVAWGSSFPTYAQSEVKPSLSEVESRAVNQVTHADEIAARLAPIKSIKDLTAYMARTSAADSLLNLLSPAAKNRFLSSLQFNEKGITSFSYADLEAELTPSQIYELLSLFGIQRTVPLMKGARVVDDTDRMIMANPIKHQCTGAHASCTLHKKLIL
ncbi:hypothetical protein [Dyella flagellata]|uniref:Uncharacterized protein n=1 Tax=Dyella flagellata TaxID=1867833 RepID=A0ABQ5XD35_9GAMM|nr:hypothetical protein [Dyella flagellata]GLQ89131.1 hypothetical protein GCM10007898_27030 [Dyella flagellata]